MGWSAHPPVARPKCRSHQRRCSRANYGGAPQPSAAAAREPAIASTRSQPSGRRDPSGLCQCPPQRSARLWCKHVAAWAPECDLALDRAERIIPSRRRDPGVPGTQTDIDLGSARFLPAAYEAGSIIAKAYTLSELPEISSLADDLRDFAAVYTRCVSLKDQLAANRRVRTSSRSERQQTVSPTPVPEFRPKDGSDYLANVKAATQRRTRKHEALIREFGDAVRSTGRAVATNVHPRDLVVHDRSGDEWLIEAKTVGLNAEPAVRDAIGQLFAYRHFYYRDAGKPDPALLALFNAPVGPAFETLLASLGIEIICRDGAVWRGSATALTLLPS